MNNETNKEFTLAELEAQMAQMCKEQEALRTIIEAKKRDEEERKKTQLLNEQAARKKALDEAGEHYRKLLTEYIKDYGTYEVKRTAEEIPVAFGKLFDFFNW